MIKIKKVLIFSFVSAAFFLLPQSITTVKAAEDTNAKIGDKYEKKIVTVDSDNDQKGVSLLESLHINQKLYRQISDNDDKEINDKTEELLVPKTNAAYEIALAYEDGDYTYAGTADNYEEAVKKAEEENQKIKTITNSLIVPVVLDTETQNLRYASQGIGRCIKYYNDSLSKKDRVCNIFQDQGLTILDRAINDNYCSEMPLISNTSTEAYVYINGYRGWMNMDINRNASNENGRCSSDMIIEPITKVSNPSFYCVNSNDGLLYHYISTTMDAKEQDINTNDARKIGKAPSYLKSGVKYLSYDGKYFYSTEGRGIHNTLSVLTLDLQHGNFDNAVNANLPYYNYYLYLPFRSRTNYTAEDLNRYIDYFIKANAYSESALKGIGDSLIENQNKYGVNALLILSVAINESNGGISDYALNRNNLFGLNATDYNTDKNASVFDSVEDGIECFCKSYISRWFADVTNSSFYGGYLGNKEYGANVKYATDPYWADKAANNACKIENYLSDFNPDNYKDYDYYQLFKFTQASTVKDVNGNDKYNVNDKYTARSGEFVGSTGLLLCNNTLDFNGKPFNEIALDMTLNSDNKNDGSYNWSSKGYIKSDSIECINIGKTNNDKADLNKDGKVDMADIALEASLYNAYGSDLNYIYDTNDDGIIDIYDLAKISSKL